MACSAVMETYFLTVRDAHPVLETGTLAGAHSAASRGGAAAETAPNRAAGADRRQEQARREGGGRCEGVDGKISQK